MSGMALQSCKWTISQRGPSTSHTWSIRGIRTANSPLVTPYILQGISISVTEVVKIWDLEERACLNTMMNISDPPRFGSRRPVTTILWHRDTQTAVLAFCSELAMLTIRRDAAKKATVTAHEDPVTKMVYLPAHDVAATGDTSGHLIFWKVGTGGRVREIRRAHLDSPITCMSADPDQNRLLTASEAGEIIMWDAVAGEALKRFVVPNPCEVCSLASLPSGVFTFGGDGRLVKFINHEPVQSDDTLLPEVPPDSSFEPKKFHKSAVTCSAACAGMLLASGDCDGTIIIWHLEFAMSLREFSTTSFREIWSQRVELDSADQDMFPPVARNAPKEVTAVTWMEDRVNLLKNNDHSELHCANLVAASDGGHIAFWSAMDGELLGSFPTLACAGEDDGVGAIAISQCNSRLYTGDTRGDLKVGFLSCSHPSDGPEFFACTQPSLTSSHSSPLSSIYS
jgi:WD40 repeat protein